MTVTGPRDLMTQFGGLGIRYDERVLAPRAWTTAQSEWAARLIRTAPPGPVLELCAGAGHIGLLAVRLAPRRLVQIDADPVACSFARRNAAGAGVRTEVRAAPLTESVRVEEQFAVIIADPPWVRSTETGRFPEDPLVAIDGGSDGLDLVRNCLEIIARHLVVAGSAVLQVGPDDLEAVSDLVATHPELVVVDAAVHERGTLVQIDRLSGT